MSNIDKDHIIANLREVYDPEMEGINVYDLGLIYDISINAEDKWVKITNKCVLSICGSDGCGYNKSRLCTRGT